MYFKPQVFKTIQFVAILFATSTIFSQTTFWSEYFPYSDGITVGTGNKWTIITTAGINYFEVRNNEFDAKDTNANEQIFLTESINISSYTNVSLSVDVLKVGGKMETGDYVNVYYKLNGGSEILFSSNGSNLGNFSSTVATQSGLNGTTIQIVVRIQNGIGNQEIYGLDNILVKGFIPPTITSLGSTSGCEGTSITINGTNFTGATASGVTIGGAPVSSITSNNGTTIVAVIGAGTTGTVSVTTSGGTATSVATFTVNTAPSITSTTPGSNVGTGTVDITATSSDSSTISWYDSLLGGVLVGTSVSGVNFTTPSISSNTMYYAQVSSGTCDSPRTAVLANIITFSEVTVSVTWPSWSSENRVEIYSPSGTLITTIDNGYAGGIDDSYSTTVNLGCLEDLNNYYFIMYDTYGDGWNGTDNITITSSGVTVINQNGDAASSGGTSVYFNVSGGICGAEINVTGNGVSIVDGETVTSAGDFTNFGDLDIGTSLTRTFTIENTGGTDLTIGAAVTLSTGTLFTVTTQPATTVLTTNTSTTFVITFSPIAVGTFTDVVTITNDDSNEDPYTFTVSGNAFSPLTLGPGGITTDLKLWLKSTSGLGYSDATAVSLWETQARGSNAIVNTAGQEPTFYDNSVNNVNFNPVISFVNDRTNAPEEYDYTYIPQQFLEGTSGFYTQEFFVVAIPDDTVSSTYASMDLFCGDSQLVNPDQTDGTGIGYGKYSVRLDNEVITFALGTSSDTTNPENDRGYGITDESTTSSYSDIAILNVRDNISAPVDGSELFYNGNNIKNKEVGIPQFINVENSRFWIGRSQGYRGSFEGRITEVISYAIRKDDTTERNKIESYLAIKYGITLGVNGTSQDYVDSDGTVIWDIDTGVPTEDAFNYNIAGIGRDDVSELNQKQSKTVNTADDITIGHGDIVTTNNLNSTNFTVDKSFLVWGNDNGTLAAQPAISVDMSSGIGGLTTTVDFTAIGRTWKVVKKGTVGVSKISIPETMLSTTITPPGDYLMFISDSPTFSPTSEYRIMSLNGSNLETLYEFTGSKKYLTFGYAPERTFVRSIQFDGIQDYLDAGDVLDLNSTAFTISAWIKRNNTNASIVSKRDSGYTTGYNFGINASGRLEMSWNGGSEIITSSIVIPTSIWHHVAVIFDGTTAKLYIDGVEDVTQTTALNTPVTNTESFLIAAADGNELNTTSFFDGNIDEVRIWDVALTQDQLRFVMNQEIVDNTNVDGSYFSSLGITPTKNDINTIPWANLKGYYPMSTYTFTNCKDNSGNGNIAALKNLTTVHYQTAPLPYLSDNNGTWDTPATWLNNTVQNLPNSLSIVDGVTRIDWNIVEISDNNSINSGANRDIAILGLNMISNTADGTDTQLTINGDTATGTGNGLTITHYLKLDGVLDLQGESQLIQTTGSDLDAVSTGYLERDQQGTENSFRYNYWSSPVNSRVTKFTIGEVLNDGTDPTNIKTIDFGASYTYADVAITSPIKLSAYWMFVLRNSGLGYSAWFQVGNTGEVLVGEGYTMKGSNTNLAEQNYTFVGKPNNGNYTLPIIANNDYLIGNPYASAIDADQFIDDNTDTTGTIYFWEHYGGNSHNLIEYQGGYATYSKAGGVSASSNPPVAGVSTSGSSVKVPGRYIPVAQAFFAVGNPIGGNIKFNNGQRIFVKESSGNSIFMKSSNIKSKNTEIEVTDLRPKFRIGFDAPKINHRQLLLTIDENTSDAVDWGYDAEIYNIISNDIYWTINDKKYVIQATNALTLDKEIPLGIETKEGGNIKIMVDALENVDENTSIYIKDNLTGETDNITNKAFEINLKAGEYKDRFVLTFQPRLKTLEEVDLIEEVHIFMNNNVSELQLNKIVDTEIQSVTLFNYLGQQVKTWDINTDNRFISLPIQITTGVYIAQIHTTLGILTKKIIIE